MLGLKLLLKRRKAKEIYVKFLEMYQSFQSLKILSPFSILILNLKDKNVGLSSHSMFCELKFPLRLGIS